jgi:hypothetical protein
LSPGPTRSGTETLRKDCNSAWVKPTLVTVVGKLQWTAGAIKVRDGRGSRDTGG